MLYVYYPLENLSFIHCELKKQKGSLWTCINVLCYGSFHGLKYLEKHYTKLLHLPTSVHNIYIKIMHRCTAFEFQCTQAISCQKKKACKVHNYLKQPGCLKCMGWLKPVLLGLTSYYFLVTITEHVILYWVNSSQLQVIAHHSASIRKDISWFNEMQWVMAITVCWCSLIAYSLQTLEHLNHTTMTN